ncbi:MAG: asparagine--tRNA ligase [Desulfovibrionaceae bacterium]|nr:asparagine--tRNA ligase [Desulfovibrionaceae bacterium]
MLIVEALKSSSPIDQIQIEGWIKSRRDSKTFSFLALNDGSCLDNIQCIVDGGTEAMANLGQAGLGSSVSITGKLVASPGQGQKWEVQVANLTLLGATDQEKYPLQKKRHTDEFLRSIPHLRPRTNKYGAMLRVRSQAAFAIHKFFHDEHFFYIQTPILTGSDCEGAGEMFRVTTLKPGVTDISQDFFGQECHLTVSGQLEAEALALALGRVYTFGPTFRAENSNTPRHVAEFWMIEPEMAFADLEILIGVAEKLLQNIPSYLLDNSIDDLQLFNKFVDKTLLTRLENLAKGGPLKHLSYTECIQILEKSSKSFVYPVSFGVDLQTEHERYLTEEYCQAPVVIYDYPKSIKPFYMRDNTDGQTVAAVDILVPGIGEIIGGSQREERLDVLLAKLKAAGLDPSDYSWYIDLREFGSVPHAGFGLGFERLIMLLTGISNIRDAIPFPKTPTTLTFQGLTSNLG